MRDPGMPPPGCKWYNVTVVILCNNKFLLIVYTVKLSIEAVVNCWEDELTLSPPDLKSTSEAAERLLSFAGGESSRSYVIRSYCGM